MLNSKMLYIMKKILFLSIIVALIFSLSCDDDYDKVELNDGNGLAVTSSGVTPLDNQVVVSMNCINADVSSVDVRFRDGSEVLKSITLADGAGTYTGTTTKLFGSEKTEVGSVVSLEFVAKMENNPRTFLTVESTDPFTFEQPSVYQDDTTRYLKYTVEPIYASVTQLDIMYKDSSGTFQEYTEDHDLANDSIAIPGTYPAGTTLMYVFTATSDAGLSYSADTISITVGALTFENSATGQLTSTMSEFDLLLNSATSEDGEVADMVLTPHNYDTLGFYSDVTMFVHDTTNAYETNDKKATIELFNQGTQMDSIPNVMKDQDYIFRRTGTDSYGIIRITNVKVSTSGTDDAIEFEYIY